MAIITTLDKYDLQNAFSGMDRDYFSLDGYQAMINLFDETDTTFELDVIALCCDFTEDDIETIYSEHCNIGRIADCKDEDTDEIDEDSLMDALNYYTYAIRLDNGNVFYQNF